MSLGKISFSRSECVGLNLINLVAGAEFKGAGTKVRMKWLYTKSIFSSFVLSSSLLMMKG